MVIGGGDKYEVRESYSDDDDDDEDDADDDDDDDDDDAEYKVHDHRRFRVVRLGEAGLVMTGSVEGGGGISTKGELICPGSSR